MPRNLSMSNLMPNDPTFGFESVSNDSNLTMNSQPLVFGASETNGYPLPSLSAVPGPADDELQRLRRQNAFLMRTLTEQRQQIEYLSSRMQSIANHVNAVPAQPVQMPYYQTVQTQQQPQSNTVQLPVKPRTISPDALLPPAA